MKNQDETLKSGWVSYENKLLLILFFTFGIVFF